MIFITVLTRERIGQMNDKELRIIGIEEHFSTPAYISEFKTKDDDEFTLAGYENIIDLGERRIGHMDEAGVSMQIVSFSSPGVEQLGKDDAIRVSRDVNEYAFKAVSENPDRIRAFMTLPTASPPDAVETLQKAKEMRFAGVCINGRIGDKYLDDPEFAPMLSEIEKMELPVYLHPCRPPKDVIKNYYSGPWPGEVSDFFSRGAIGWHIETAIHALRIIFSGILDRNPDLQIVIGHLGEGLPFFFDRVQKLMPKERTKLDRTISEYLKDNFYYTTAGFNYNAVFSCLAEQVSMDRILFSADYPFCNMQAAVDFLNELPLSETDKQKIAHENVEKLFKLI